MKLIEIGFAMILVVFMTLIIVGFNTFAFLAFWNWVLVPVFNIQGVSLIQGVIGGLFISVLVNRPSVKR